MKLKLLGPPGCGKTTRLLQHLEKELEKGTPPERIAFLTFTRAARIEALTRTGKTDVEFPYLKTIHSICYHQLTIGKDQIVRPDTLRTFGRKIGVKLSGTDFDPWIEEYERGIDAPTRDDFLLQANHRGRHRKIMLKESLFDISLEIDFKYATWFTKAYRAWKNANGLLDYTDLLSRYIEVGKPLDIDAIFIDEAQDLSALQWDAVSILGGLASRWYIAGDDDQAIFHWAGADGTIFQDLEVDQTEILNQSYRVSKAVHKSSMGIVSRINKRLEKSYSPTESEGEVSNTGYLASADLSQKTFILFRNHYRGAEIAQLLRSENIPYIGKGSPLLDINVRSAMYSFYQLIKTGKSPAESVKRLLRFADQDYIRPGINSLVRSKKILTSEDVFIRKLRPIDWKRLFPKLPGSDSIEQHIKEHGLLRTALPMVELMSIHQSKGREAHTVIIDPEMSRAVWLGMIARPDDEHRVWYVAMTRAKERVFFMLPDGNYSYKF